MTGKIGRRENILEEKKTGEKEEYGLEMDDQNGLYEKFVFWILRERGRRIRR